MAARSQNTKNRDAEFLFGLWQAEWISAQAAPNFGVFSETWPATLKL
jgi:hypothetical protein